MHLIPAFQSIDFCKLESKMLSTVKTRTEVAFVFNWMKKNKKVSIDIKHTIKRYNYSKNFLNWHFADLNFIIIFRNSLWQWEDSDGGQFEFDVIYKGSLANGQQTIFCNKSFASCGDFQRPALTFNLNGVKNQFENIVTPLISCEFDLRTE